MKMIKTKHQYYESICQYENMILIAYFLKCPDMGAICLN